MSLLVSLVIGCWFRSIRSPSSHSDATLWVCGCRVNRTTSLACLRSGESCGGYPWIVILVEPSFETWVKVFVDELETIDAGTTFETTLETMERSTVCKRKNHINRDCGNQRMCNSLFSGSSSSFGSYAVSIS